MTEGIAPFLLLPPLLLLSGFVSGSESALFSLSLEDRARLKARAGSVAARDALALLESPRALLVAILFGNLVVNFLIVAVSTHALAPLGGQAVLLGGALVTAAVIVLGEVGPKAVGVTRPVPVALLAARPLLAFRRLLQLLGVVGPLERLVVWVIDRVERRLPPAQAALTDRELRRFVELQGREGLERQMAELLADVMELRRRRAHEIMTPRVDLIAFDVEHDTREELLALVRRHRHGKILVHRGGGLDALDGWLSVREVLARPDVPLAQLVKKLWLVPHTKSLESLLREMTERHEPIALVVGEYGGTRGLVTLEDVVEEITGDIAREHATPLIEPLADGTWRLAGRFPLREVVDLLGVEVPSGPTTLSGLMATLLGRLPEVGDLVWHAGIQLRVDAVEHRRATQVRVALPGPDHVPPPAPPGEVSGGMTWSAATRARARLEKFAESNPTHDAPPGGAGEGGSP